MTTSRNSIFDEIFRVALAEGPSIGPQCLSRFTNDSDDGRTLSVSNAVQLLDELNDEFAFLANQVKKGLPAGPEDTDRWVAAVRYALRQIVNWNPSSQGALRELGALIVVTQTLGFGSQGLLSIVAQLNHETLQIGLSQIIRESEVAPYGSSHHYPTKPELDLNQASNVGDFERLGHLLRHIAPHPREDVMGAAAILYHIAPNALIDTLVARNDVLTSILVVAALRNNAPSFALQVPLAHFKFLCTFDRLGWIEVNQNDDSWPDVFRQILLQIAATTHWHAWMQALFKYPDDGVKENALADVLAALEPGHWAEFIRALPLSYSGRSAPALATILLRFSSQVSEAQARTMWEIAFERWNAWNYVGDGTNHMFSPMSCSLDYPVAMHYAQMSATTLETEEENLANRLENIETEWFKSASDLVTTRNQILCRIRLIRHGRELAQGSSNVLPHRYQSNEGPFFNVRYLYHEVPHS